jgi:hypothetical protein
MKKAVFNLSLLVLSSLPVGLARSADYNATGSYTGKTLLEECEEVLTFAETGPDQYSFHIGASYCMGMVNGMMALNAIYRSKADSAPLFCPPATPITNVQGARLVVDYLREHSAQLTLDASSLMYFAFARAYPCE